MNDAVNQMAATIAALRMLLAGDDRSKPDDVTVVACTGVTQKLVEVMMGHAAEGRSTLLAIFELDDDIALLSRIMIVDASTKNGEINIGGGRLAHKADDSFVILSVNRDSPYEYSFGCNGRRLERCEGCHDQDHALMELRGMQALITKSASVACQTEASTASINHC